MQKITQLKLHHGRLHYSIIFFDLKVLKITVIFSFFFFILNNSQQRKVRGLSETLIFKNTKYYSFFQEFFLPTVR